MGNQPNNVYNSAMADIPVILLKNTYNLNGAGVSAISILTLFPNKSNMNLPYAKVQKLKE
ncbi:hypothetical protein WKK05_40280 (plasmid) [Nostoc sp. UHCC 0302]|uniref:hypothetical protein n=1 Tax=Nostoc sp. UHCC 0302 TaxID=3134896 RepID=UPI00311CAD26